MIPVRKAGSTAEGDRGESAATAAFQPPPAAVRTAGEHQPVSPRKSLVPTITPNLTLTISPNLTEYSMLDNCHPGSRVTS